MKYVPYKNRLPDSQYSRILAEVLTHGDFLPSRQGPNAWTLMQQTMRFELANGFPMITERDVSSFWRKPIGELCAFINGATTLEELEEFGCDWWEPWATPEKSERIGHDPGSLGQGSYGGAFHDFPAGALSVDQFDLLVKQIRKHPGDRTHFVSPWVAGDVLRGDGDYMPGATIAPCHGWVHVRIVRKKLHLHMFQRSGDLPVGVPSNMIQYGALMLMLSQLTGYEPGVYYHTISDAHIYQDQAEYALKMINREPRALPAVQLNREGLQVTDIHDFRAEHFELTGYNPHPAIPRIPVSP